jgi:hypothetical protein
MRSTYGRRSISSTIQRLLFRTLLSVSKTRPHGDLVLVADNDDQFDQIESALLLIERNLPIRYRQIQRDLRYIWVRSMMGYAQFDRAIWACSIRPEVFQGNQVSPEDVALILVHEATHARLAKLGFGYDEAIRARIEAICHRRELAFATRLGDGEAIYSAGYYLANPLDYSDEAVLARDELEMGEFVSKYGLPGWVAEFLRRTRRWNDRRRKRDD